MSQSRSLFGLLVGLTLCVCIWHISTQEAQLIANQYANDPPDYADASEALIPHPNNTTVANSSTSPTSAAADAAAIDQLPALAAMPNDLSQLIDLTDFAYLIDQPPCNAVNGPGIAPAESSTSLSSSPASPTTVPTTTSPPPPPLLIMVHSAPGNWAKRNMIRETWGRDDDDDTRGRTRVLFLLGAVQQPQAQHKIAKEHYLYADILQGNFVDAYRNMTYKHAMALKWFAYNCPGQPYLLKTDDDVFLNTPNALRYLAAASTPRRNLMLCSRKHRSRISRSYRSKWRVGMQEYAGYYFPDYCPGYYILYSSDVVQRLYREAQRTPYFWIDDVHMTGTLRIGANVTITPFEGDLYLSEQQQERWVNGGGGASAVAAEDASTFENFVFTYPNPKPDRIQYLWRQFGQGKAMGSASSNSPSTTRPEVQYVSSPSFS